MPARHIRRRPLSQLQLKSCNAHQAATERYLAHDSYHIAENTLEARTTWNDYLYGGDIESKSRAVENSANVTAETLSTLHHTSLWRHPIPTPFCNTQSALRSAT